MRNAVWFLPIVTRGLAVCALLAGLAAGFIESTFGVGFVCFDSCPSRHFYFSNLGPSALRLLTPCVVFEMLAMAVFVAFCLATRQIRRGVLALIVLLGGALVSVGLLTALALHAQATLPIWGGDAGDLLREGPLETWQGEWGLAMTLVPLAWSGVLAYLQWRR